MNTRAYIVACVVALLALSLSASFASASPVAPFSSVLLNKCPSPLYTSLDAASGNYYLACSTGIVMYNPSTEASTLIATVAQCPTPTAVLRDATSNSVLAACSTAGLLRFNADGSSSVLVSPQTGRKVTSVSVDESIAQLYYYTADSEYSGPVLTTVGSVNLAAGGGLAPVVTPLANSTQCGNAFQVHGVNGVVVASCSNFGSTSPVVYVPTAVIIANGVVRALISSSVCYYPQGILLQPNGQVLVGCSSIYSSNQGSLSVLSINSTNLGYSVVLAQRDCDQATSFSRDSVTGLVYISCTGFAGGLWAINSLAPLSLTRLVNQNTCWNGQHVLALPGANTQVLSCMYQDVLKVVNGGLVSFITNQCPTPLSLSFDVRTGTLDALCSNFAVASVDSQGSKNIVSFPRTCYPMRVLRDTIDGMTAYVSCGEGGAKILSLPDAGGMSTRSAGSMTGSCSMAMVQPSMVGSALFVSCAESIFETNSTGGPATQFVAGSSVGCPSIVDMMVDATGAINALCFYNTYNIMAQYSSNGSVTATLPYSVWLSGCAAVNILSPVLDPITGRIVAVCNGKVIHVALTPTPSITTFAPAGCSPNRVAAFNNTAYYTCASGAGVWATKLGGAPVQILSQLDCTNPFHVVIDGTGRKVFVGCAQGIIGVDVSALVLPATVPAVSSSSTGSRLALSSTGSVNTASTGTTGGSTTASAGTDSSSSGGSSPLPTPTGSNGTASAVQSVSAAACLATLVTILAIAA